jgi:hypothetical protein
VMDADQVGFIRRGEGKKKGLELRIPTVLE